MTRKPEDIRHALDTTLSGASHDPTLYNRVVNASKGDSPPVKRKLTLSMALVMILVLMTGTVAFAAAYRGVSWFLTEQTCEPTALDPALLMDALQQNHTSERLNATVEDAYWDGSSLSIAFHVTASDPSMVVVIPCDTQTHEHYRPVEDADILLEMPEFINITTGGEITRPLGGSANWLYEEDGTLTIMHSFAVNDMSEPVGISIPITNTRVSDGTEEFAMLHCNLPAMIDPIGEHDHDWAPATCVSPMTCRVCGRYTGGLGNHNYQLKADMNVRACIVCGIEMSPLVDDVHMVNAGSICPGERSNYVATLQLRLQDLGYYNGNITGQYDEETTAAVKTYQEDHSLVPDGVCTPDTLALMFN